MIIKSFPLALWALTVILFTGSYLSLVLDGHIGNTQSSENCQYLFGSHKAQKIKRYCAVFVMVIAVIRVIFDIWEQFMNTMKLLPSPSSRIVCRPGEVLHFRFYRVTFFLSCLIVLADCIHNFRGLSLSFDKLVGFEGVISPIIIIWPVLYFIKVIPHLGHM